MLTWFTKKQNLLGDMKFVANLYFKCLTEMVSDKLSLYFTYGPILCFMVIAISQFIPSSSWSENKF